MYIVLGATGRVGSSVAASLLEKGEKIVAVARNREKTGELERRGAIIETVDVHETEKLREAFKKGKRLFLLNPPADPASDTVAEEKRSVSSILNALENSGIEKVVAESTYGAQSGDGIGDLGVLFGMEKRLKEMDLAVDVIRAAYYMSNWEMSVESAEKEGAIHTFYPPDFELPMVAPDDIGRIAAEFLIENSKGFRLHYVEGPEIYSSADVAGAFGEALNKKVEAVQIPKEKWFESLKQFGFSDEAVRSMAKMTELTIENVEKPKSPIRGATDLDEYIENLVSNIPNRH